VQSISAFGTRTKNLSEKELDKFTATNEPDHVAVGTLLIGTADPEPEGIGEFIVLMHRDAWVAGPFRRCQDVAW
jgi:hypothetical protein